MARRSSGSANTTRVPTTANTIITMLAAGSGVLASCRLLYGPEIPTSCYSTQRRQYLDPSWPSLF